MLLLNYTDYFTENTRDYKQECDFSSLVIPKGLQFNVHQYLATLIYVRKEAC